MLHRGGAGASGELRGVDEASAAVALPQDPAVPASSAPHRGHPHHEGGGITDNPSQLIFGLQWRSDGSFVCVCVSDSGQPPAALRPGRTVRGRA